MKRKWILACMMLGSACATKASGNKFASKTAEDKNTTALASARANHLSDEMIRGLHLNNYQSNKVREINMKVAEQITAIEEQYAGNQAKIDELSKSALAERDQFLESVLSTVQYNDYFGHRKDYVAMDREFIADVNQGEDGAGEGAISGTTPDANVTTVNVN
jgi:hypothetical protein